VAACLHLKKAAVTSDMTAHPLLTLTGNWLRSRVVAVGSSTHPLELGESCIRNLRPLCIHYFTVAGEQSCTGRSGLDIDELTHVVALDSGKELFDRSMIGLRVFFFGCGWLRRTIRGSGEQAFSPAA
jgi:hypothetical protein